MARYRAHELNLSEGELVIARAELDALHDDLYVLSCAIDDVERDVSNGRATKEELREALDWLLDAARPLRARQLRAPSSHPSIPS